MDSLKSYETIQLRGLSKQELIQILMSYAPKQQPMSIRMSDQLESRSKKDLIEMIEQANEDTTKGKLK